jgi:hypothetical protein
MDDSDVRLCPVCKGQMEFIQRYYIWRCPEHGLFLHNQLQPHEQIKIGEFTWMRKGGIFMSIAPPIAVNIGHAISLSHKGATYPVEKER